MEMKLKFNLKLTLDVNMKPNIECEYVHYWNWALKSKLKLNGKFSVNLKLSFRAQLV